MVYIRVVERGDEEEELSQRKQEKQEQCFPFFLSQFRDVCGCVGAIKLQPKHKRRVQAARDIK